MKEISMHPEVTKSGPGVPVAVFVVMVIIATGLSVLMMLLANTCDKRTDALAAAQHDLDDTRRVLGAYQAAAAARRQVTMSTTATMSALCGPAGLSYQAAVSPGTASIVFPNACRVDVVTECR